MLLDEGLFQPEVGAFLPRNGTELLYEGLVLPEEECVGSVCRRDAGIGI